jgi:predicted GTPase
MKKAMMIVIIASQVTKSNIGAAVVSQVSLGPVSVHLSGSRPPIMVSLITTRIGSCTKTCLVSKELQAVSIR